MISKKEYNENRLKPLTGSKAMKPAKRVKKYHKALDQLHAIVKYNTHPGSEDYYHFTKLLKGLETQLDECSCLKKIHDAQVAKKAIDSHEHIKRRSFVARLKHCFHYLF